MPHSKTNIAYINGVVYNGPEILKDKVLLMCGEKVEAICEFDTIPNGYNIKDADGHGIAPAFADLQVYGGDGSMFSLTPDTASLDAIYRECRQQGTGWFQATVATNSIDIMLQAFAAAKEYRQQQKPGLIGVHLEGPYINVAKKGAHQERFIHKPTVEEVNLLLKEGAGVFTMMTLAPECCDTKIIHMLREAGVLVSAGHSNADYETAIAGFENGITTATHLFNAMPAFLNREPGLVGAIFNSDVCCSIIADGIHVDYASLGIAKKIMNDRLFLITDAITAWKGEGYHYIKKTDRYVTEDGILAGACLSMMQAVKNCVNHAGIPLAEAIQMATVYPARVMNKTAAWGTLEKGSEPGLIFFNEAFELIEL